MEEIVKKVETPTFETLLVKEEGTPVGLKESQDRELRLRLTAEAKENMKKRAIFIREAPVGAGDSAWEIWCDEGAYLGGDDEAPPPLAYLTAAIAF